MEILKKVVNTKRLGNIEVEMNTSVDENGMLYSVVSHQALRKLVIENKVSYEYQVDLLNDNHAVIECKMTIGEDTVIGIGESTDLSLQNRMQIALQYPSTMAYKRAFDDAAVMLFGFPVRYYGDSAIQACSSNAPAPEANAPEAFQADTKANIPNETTVKQTATKETETIAPTETEETAVLTETKETAILTETKETAVLTETKETAVLTETEETAVLTETEETAVLTETEEIAVSTETEETDVEAETAVDRLEELGKEMVTFTDKTKGKSFKEVVESAGQKWLNWALNQYNPKDAERIENVTKFREYCKLRGITGKE